MVGLEVGLAVGAHRAVGGGEHFLMHLLKHFFRAFFVQLVLEH